ncbi:hypothetical protein B0A48_16951 [Cryoendolithus antarcticus]|uniref:DUF7371 domain-containing protein n=1 Tax=Cryoendolithus antarcticus TaxID=1507870 RepID=A0A1V8SD56_9PEZI|nr:hypothetical protein B0A48_16951 [Cryoendolithus antarcticus]
MPGLFWWTFIDVRFDTEYNFARQYSYNSSNTFAMSTKYTHTSRRSMSPEASSSVSIALLSGRYAPRSSLRQRKQPTNGPTPHLGRTVQPGKVLAKADRQPRIDSQADPQQEEEEENFDEWSFAYLRRKISRTFASYRLLERINASPAENLAPEAVINAAQELRSGVRRQNIRRMIVALMLILIVFGASHTVITHLLNASRASAQCITSTVYYPVTTTYTTSIYPTTCATSSAGLASANTESSTTTYTTTSTSVSTVTVTVTATASSSTTSTLPFLFTGDSTTTAWLYGHSPFSGASLVTATTIIPVSAAALSSSSTSSSQSPAPGSTLSYVYRTSTVQITLTRTVTVTPDAVTSTSYSVASDSTSTVHTTRTTTVTALSALMRTSFGGSGSLGWNATSPIIPSGTGSVANVYSNGIPTTATVTYYWASSGGQTYSTSTTTLTTTFYGALPQDTTVTGNATTMTETLSHVAGPATTTSTGSTVTSSTNNSSLADAASTSSSSSGFPTMTPGSYGILPTAAPTGSSAGTEVTSVHGKGVATSSVDVGAAGFSSPSSSTARSPSTQAPSPTSTLTSIGGPTSIPSSSGNTSSITASSTATSVTYSRAELTSIVSSIMGATTYGVVNSTANTLLPSSSVFHSYGYSAPLVTASSSTTSLSSVISSTQLLSTLGSSLANGGVPALPATTALSSSSSASYSTSSTTSMSSSTADAVPFSSPTLPSSTVASSIPPTPSVCGEHGNFTLTFDDLPTFSGNDSLDITQAPPIWNPYHHLTFADGYVYAPLPREPYSPHSGSKLAVFLGNGTGKTLSPSAMSPGSTSGEPGEISNGQYDGNTAFWFDARTAWVDCDNPGPDSCILNVTGYIWDTSINDDIGAYKTQYTIPPCPQQQNCQLVPITFPPSFRALTGLQIQAFVGEQQRMFFLDDLALGWSNNTCAAGLTRQSGGRGFRPGESGEVAKRARGVRKWVGA